jgi:hypothetical protein
MVVAGDRWPMSEALSRGARRRKEREAAKNGESDTVKPPGIIHLQNPVADQFGAFIFGNATKCERVVEQNSHMGAHIVICGAGPSLGDTEARQVLRGDYDQLWGCNSAMPWLLEEHYPVTHGFTIDQTPHMLEEWWDAPPVEYIVASTIHPHLTDWLQEEHNRTLHFFHNFVGLQGKPVEYGVCMGCYAMSDAGVGECSECGGKVEDYVMPYEEWIYQALYPATVRVGAGLNSVTRAIEVAYFMGAEKVSVLGADCAMRITERPPEDAVAGSPRHVEWLRTKAVMHADGSDPLRSGATSTTLGAEIDGVWWETKPDMAITAKFLVQMKEHFGDRLVLVGDTLPNALVGKPQEFLDRLPAIRSADGKETVYHPPEVAEDGVT